MPIPSSLCVIPQAPDTDAALHLPASDQDHRTTRRATNVGDAEAFSVAAHAVQHGGSEHVVLWTFCS